MLEQDFGVLGGVLDIEPVSRGVPMIGTGNVGGVVLDRTSELLTYRGQVRRLQLYC